jgi:hypothetical protein
LKAEQRLIAENKKLVTKELNNAMRRQKRLRVKVANLSDEDLIEILKQRKERTVGKDASEQSQSPASKRSSDAMSPDLSEIGTPERKGLIDRMSDAV